MSEIVENPKEKALKLLPEEERRVYDSFKESGKPGLAPSTSATFFELYLNGSTVFDIHKINKSFELGAIIDAKVKYGWDEMRNNYTAELQQRAMSRLLQVQSESVQFLADAMTATHKKHGQALRKYIQTGDDRDLEGFDLGSITTYSRAIEAILKITGQDQKKKVQVEGNISTNLKLGDMGKKALTQEQASAVLSILASEEDSDVE